MANSEDEQTRDEAVDGPKLVAAILNKMRPENRERITRAIQTANPKLYVKIEENLYNFDDLADLTPQGMQLLLNAISAQDLLLSLKTASDKVKKVLFENMSERKRSIVQSDFDAMPPVRLSDIEEAKKRILQKLEELRRTGAIRNQSTSDVWV